MRTLLDAEGFRVAFAVGLVGVVAVVGVRLTGPARVGASIVALVALLAGLRAEDALSLRLVIAVLLLAAAGAASRVWWRPVHMFLLTPGALVLASIPDGIDWWVRVLIFAVTVVGAPLATSVEARAPRLVPLLLLMSAAGVYVCVPDTEIAAALLGATAVPALMALDPRLPARVGATAAMTGLLVYVAAIEGHGRPGAVVGGMACLGMLALAPLSRWRRAPLAPSNIVAVTVVHIALVLFVARVAGFRESAWAAAGLSGLAFVVAWLVLAIAIRGRRPSAPA